MLCLFFCLFLWVKSSVLVANFGGNFRWEKINIATVSVWNYICTFYFDAISSENRDKINEQFVIPARNCGYSFQWQYLGLYQVKLSIQIVVKCIVGEARLIWSLQCRYNQKTSLVLYNHQYPHVIIIIIISCFSVYMKMTNNGSRCPVYLKFIVTLLFISLNSQLKVGISCHTATILIIIIWEWWCCLEIEYYL